MLFRYHHILFPDHKISLLDETIQVLCCLLDFNSNPVSQEATSDLLQDNNSLELNPGTTSNPVHKKIPKNLFRYFVFRMYRVEDFKLLCDAFAILLVYPIYSVKSLLPGSRPLFRTYPELLVLFWRLVEVNQVMQTFKLFQIMIKLFHCQKLTIILGFFPVRCGL